LKQAVRVGAALVAMVLIAVFLTGTAGAGQGNAANATGTDKSVSDVYLVMLQEAPVAAYEGGVAGYPATKPAPGKKLDKKAPNVEKYAGHLRSRHNALANGVGAARTYDYVYSLNGFAAVPWSQRGRRHLEPARRPVQGRRGRRHRRCRHRHLARASELRRHRLRSRAR
jgi:hypothetical protein